MFWNDRDEQSDARTFVVTGTRRLSYAEVFEASDRLYQRSNRGVVAILCDKSPATVIAYVGALRRGCIPLLLDGATKPKALARILSAYCPAYLFVTGPSVPDGYRQLEKVGEGKLCEKTGPVPPTELHPELALLIPTSGSTGDPKSVRLSARNVEACTDAVCEYLLMTPERVAVSLLPLHYSYGLSVLHNTMNVRGSIVMTDLSILDRDFLGFCETKGVTDLAGVPFIFEALRRARLSEGLTRQLVSVTQAGGRLNPAITRHFLELFAGSSTRYYTMYGQTEAAPRISYLPPEAGIEKLGTVGVPISCGQVSIDGASGGELVYQGPNVCLGYAQTAADLSKGDEFSGVIKTGDLAQIDEDGFITITGRSKRFVKMHGTSVNLDHVEGLLKTAGIDCLVVGRDNRIVVCYRDTDQASVERAAAQNFAFHPSTFTLREVPELPQTTSGKPDYVAALREYGDAR